MSVTASGSGNALASSIHPNGMWHLWLPRHQWRALRTAERAALKAWRGAQWQLPTPAVEERAIAVQGRRCSSSRPSAPPRSELGGRPLPVDVVIWGGRQEARQARLPHAAPVLLTHSDGPTAHATQAAQARARRCSSAGHRTPQARGTMTGRGERHGVLSARSTYISPTFGRVSRITVRCKTLIGEGYRRAASTVFSNPHYISKRLGRLAVTVVKRGVVVTCPILTD